MANKNIRISEQSIGDYLEDLKARTPMPAGGAASALAGAQGAALIMMVANFTVGNAGYAEFEELNLRALAEADDIRAELLRAASDDGDAFGLVSAAYAMPKDTEAQRRIRSEAIALASVEASMPPIRTMKAAFSALELACELIGKSNKNLECDLYVAALQLKAAIRGAKYNVDANVPFIRDAKVAEALRSESEDIIKRTDEIDI